MFFKFFNVSESVAKSQLIRIMLKLEIIDVKSHLNLVLESIALVSFSSASQVIPIFSSFLVIADDFLCFGEKGAFLTSLKEQISNKNLEDIHRGVREILKVYAQRGNWERRKLGEVFEI